MIRLRELLFRLQPLFRKRKIEAGLSEEIQAHLAMAIEANVAVGMSPEEARYAALREFGGVEQIKERYRDERGVAWIEHLVQDLRYAVRQLRKTPGFTAVVILSLALGIGANTAIFSFINDVLLRKLPVKNPNELVLFNWLAEPESMRQRSWSGRVVDEPGTGLWLGTTFSGPVFEQFRQHSPALSDVFAFVQTVRPVKVTTGGQAETVRLAQVVSGNYHAGLGVSAALGRLLTPADDQPGAAPVVVISYGFWQRKFGGDPAVIGQVLTANTVPCMIVGVTPREFTGTGEVGEVPDLTFPMVKKLELEPFDRSPTNTWRLNIMGRLKPGATAGQVRASLEGLYREDVRQGDAAKMKERRGPAIAPMDVPQLRVVSGARGLSQTRKNYVPSLQIMMGLVALVMIAACANVANLLLARGAARRKEIGIRLALGASRGRLVRQLLTESMLLALLGAAAGVGLAWWARDGLLALRPIGPNSGLVFTLELDGHVLAFTTAVAMLTGVAFGLLPALRATRINLTEEFQGGTRNLGAGSRPALARSLVVLQVGLSLVLLIGAALYVRTLRNLQEVDLGFNRAGVLLFRVDASLASDRKWREIVQLHDRIVERLSSIPGVKGVTYSYRPLIGVFTDFAGSLVWVPGYTVPGKEEMAQGHWIAPKFFDVFEIPLMLGRKFDARDFDSARSGSVAIVNEAFARKYFGEENPIGRLFGKNKIGAAPAGIEIVGVVRDTKWLVREAPRPNVYWPYPSLGFPTASFAVRASGDPHALTSAIRGAVREIDPKLPLYDVRTQDEDMDRLFHQERLFVALSSFLGLLALALASIGLYGLMSYTVHRRTGEIGLRMALGARSGRVIGMIVRESLTLVCLGIVLGIAGAWAASRLIAKMLFGLSATDPVTYAGVALLFTGVALLACLLPARRAAKVDPMVALRCE
ncbi:MAG: ABC transporter permease [Opitutaceae bacterium]|nr:ABC transporter permease [Opitutaceae bacterium]